MTISQMRWQNNISILAYVVALVAYNIHLAAWYVSDWQLTIRIAKCNDRVDETGRRSVRFQDLGGVVRYLSALTVAAEDEFGLRALLHCVFDELKYRS